MTRIVFALVLSVTVLSWGPTPARANGGNAHFWISLEALEHLPEGPLRELLVAPEHRSILLNGSVFPDGGYVMGDDYGELAHWEPFLEGYRRWIVRTFDPPYDQGEAAAHVVFWLGVASHDMADQVFDWFFMTVSEVEDASGWAAGGSLLGSLDPASDVILVADTGLDQPLEPWLPGDDLAAVFSEEIGYDVSSSLLTSGQDFLEVVLQYPRDTAQNDPERVAELRDQFAWAAANLLDPLVPGSPPCEARTVAAYWQALWDRLHGVVNPENQIIATIPAPGSVGHLTDHTHPSSAVGVVFGHGVDTDSLDVRVTTAAGDELPVALSVRGGQWGNAVRVSPQADWPADSELTVTVAGGLLTIDDGVFEQPWSFGFSTAPGTADTPCVDPTPNTSDPTPSDPGGCRTAPGPAGSFPLAFTLWLWLLRRHRGRRQRSSRPC